MNDSFSQAESCSPASAARTGAVLPLEAASLSASEHLSRFGYALIRDAFTANAMQQLAEQIAVAMQGDAEVVLRSRGSAYGSRDLVAIVPEVQELAGVPALRRFLVEQLGEDVGLVRSLFFDKPPDRAWSLPWHRDRTIAVKDNSPRSTLFSKPTLKAGIPHVEAPESLLAEMLTLRVHLDPMTAENGPLSVVPASHREPPEAIFSGVEIHADAGEVLAMRPLLSHSSSMPKPGVTAHRRIVHLEFAPRDSLPDGYEWRSFLRVQ